MGMARDSGPLGYDANLQADEGVSVSGRPIAAELGAGRMGKLAVDKVRGRNGVDSPLPPATLSRGSSEGANGICGCPNGVHN